MEGEPTLVFTWDPRAHEWVKERGPSDAMSPVFAPLDESAVQTYFLDTHNGRWTSTILGAQGRQIGFELGNGHRVPAVAGLAIPTRPPRVSARAASAAATASVDEGAPHTRRRTPVAAGVAVMLLVAGTAIVASQTIFAPALPASAAPFQMKHEVTPEPGAASAAAATVTTSASAPASATVEPTVAPAQAPAAARPAAQQLSVVLPDGTQVYASAPLTVAQNTSFRVAVSVAYPGGRPGTGSVLLYFGSAGAPIASAQGQLNVAGNTSIVLTSYVAMGDQPLRVVYGGPGAYALGTISVR